MACRCAPALVVLRDQFNRAWPNRDKASDGCCGDPAHAARKSDHNPTDGYAHALDIDEDIAPGLSAKPLLLYVPLLLNDPRTKYVIYEGRIYFPDGTDRAYTGANAHAHHLHLSIKTTATHDTTPWAIGAPDEEDDLTPDQAKQLADNTAAVARIESLLAEVDARQERQGLDLGKIKESLARIEAKP